MCLSLPTQSKICLYIHFRLLLLLLIIEGGGYGFGDNVQDVLLREKSFRAHCLQGSRQLFMKCHWRASGVVCLDVWALGNEGDTWVAKEMCGWGQACEHGGP